ncbi:hypothetical protein [Clostridium sp. B9]|uniref:hypothetical protein n=1 Tax=Clostridium sp. B9 TaxID=3423224 RepID=UPI003D2EEBDD
MAHNKSYRSFIILQEDEKGHSMASDKPLTGYAKIETKNDKCRVSFYAQNLKKEYKDCCMILICNKKDFKKNINLGPMNISQHGKAEMNIEYDSINIGDLNISYDKIVGAAIGKEINGRTVFFMCGFLNSQMPKDNWKNYEMKKINAGEKSDKTVKEYKYKKDEEDKKVDKKNKEEKKSEKKKDYNESKYYDDKYSDEKVDKEEIEKEVPKKEKIECEVESKHYDRDDHDYYMREKDSHENKEEVKRDLKAIESLERTSDTYVGDSYELESRFNRYEKSIEENKLRSKKKMMEDTYEVDFDSPIGEVLVGALEGCEKVCGFAEDIKRCAWYKVNIDSFDDMCNMSNYNKYAMMYYPMINYYPYINKSGHFFFGIKCDKNGEIKYMLYAIPGTKGRKDQPYGGRTGFVTWDKHGDEGNGYWIMFYDFENSSVVIPMK